LEKHKQRQLFSASTEAKLTNGCYNPEDFFVSGGRSAASLTANSLDTDHQRRLTETAMASKLKQRENNEQVNGVSVRKHPDQFGDKQVNGVYLAPGTMRTGCPSEHPNAYRIWDGTCPLFDRQIYRRRTIGGVLKLNHVQNGRLLADDPGLTFC